MNRTWIWAVCGLLCCGLAMAEEPATGIVSETGYGDFKLDEKGTVRQFNLSQKTSQFDPDAWRPTKGDKVTVTFTVTETKRGSKLVVDKVTLVKAGPDTLLPPASPVTATVVEKGKTALLVKLAKGDGEMRLATGKKTEYLPVGWVPQAGEKVKIDFRVEKSRMTYNVNFVADKVEKVK